MSKISCGILIIDIAIIEKVLLDSFECFCCWLTLRENPRNLFQFFLGKALEKNVTQFWV
jgi:hypothetical protein